MRKLITISILAFFALGSVSAQFVDGAKRYETVEEAQKAADKFEKEAAGYDVLAGRQMSRSDIDKSRNRTYAEQCRAAARDARRQAEELKQQGEVKHKHEQLLKTLQDK